MQGLQNRALKIFPITANSWCNHSVSQISATSLLALLSEGCTWSVWSRADVGWLGANHLGLHQWLALPCCCHNCWFWFSLSGCFSSGIIRLRDGFHDRYPVEDYLDLFDLAAHQIQSVLQSDAVKEQGKRSSIVIGRAETAPTFSGAPSTLAVLRAETPEGDFVAGSQHWGPGVALLWCAWKLLAFFSFFLC